MPMTVNAFRTPLITEKNKQKVIIDKKVAEDGKKTQTATDL